MGQKSPKNSGTGVRGQRKNGFSPHFGGVFGPIFGLSPHFWEKTNTCSRLVLANKQVFDEKGDKRGQRGQILSPFLSPLKRRCIRTNRIFSNSGSMEGDKQGTNRGQTGDKNGDKNPKVGDFDSPDITEEPAEQQKFCPLLNYLTIWFRPMYRKEHFCPRFHLFYIYIISFFFDFSIYKYTEWGQNLSPFSVSSDVSPEPICPLCPLNVLKCSPFFPLYRGKGGGGQNFGFCPLFVPFVPLTC